METLLQKQGSGKVLLSEFILSSSLLDPNLDQIILEDGS